MNHGSLIDAWRRLWEKGEGPGLRMGVGTPEKSGDSALKGRIWPRGANRLLTSWSFLRQNLTTLRQNLTTREQSLTTLGHNLTAFLLSITTQPLRIAHVELSIVTLKP